MKRSILKYKNQIAIIIIFLVSVWILFPLWKDPYVMGHDTGYHLSNIEAIIEQIQYNFFTPTKIVGNIAHNFGYGTRLFYPPLPHTVASYLGFFFKSPIIGIKMTYFLALFCSGITMYFCQKRFSGSVKIGLFSAIIYMLFSVSLILYLCSRCPSRDFFVYFFTDDFTRCV